MDVKYSEALFECGITTLLNENGDIVKTFDYVPKEVIQDMLKEAQEKMRDEAGASTVLRGLFYALTTLKALCFGENAKVLPFVSTGAEGETEVCHSLNYIEHYVKGARETIDEFFASGKDKTRKNCEYTLARVFSVALREHTLKELSGLGNDDISNTFLCICECKGRWDWK